MVNARSATATRARTCAKHFLVICTSGFVVVTQIWKKNFHKISRVLVFCSFFFALYTIYMTKTADKLLIFTKRIILLVKIVILQTKFWATFLFSFDLNSSLFYHSWIFECLFLIVEAYRCSNFSIIFFFNLVVFTGQEKTQALVAWGK